MKFAVFTDLHYDVIPDAKRRLHEFINIINEEKVEFIVELGDLCHPIDENKNIINVLSECVPSYFTIGNHDSDAYPIDIVLKFLRLNHSYYSFIVNNVKFIMLDANYYKTPNGIRTYYEHSYDATTDDYPYVPQDQVVWLKRELEDDQYYYIIFSHHSLANDFKKRGISNRAEIRKLLDHKNKNGKKVLLCMNGHDHGDDLKVINGIPYYTLNSMSYIWHGTKETFNYSTEIHEKFPHLKDMILYEEPLHVIVTVDENMKIRIDGMEGHYQNITPKEIGLGSVWNAVSIEPRTSSIYIN